MNAAFRRFKELADKKHEIFDEDLQALVTESLDQQENESYKLLTLKVCTQTGETPVANVTVASGAEEQSASSEGSGPVDASFRAIESIVKSNAALQLYSVNAITSGTDAQGEVSVRLEHDGTYRQRSWC